MNTFDSKFINEKKLTDNAVLQRVINAAGYPYSLILVNGREVMSAETKYEEGLLKDFWDRQNRNPERW
jgi:hypothetical protein